MSRVPARLFASRLIACVLAARRAAAVEKVTNETKEITDAAEKDNIELVQLRRESSALQSTAVRAASSCIASSGYTLIELYSKT